MDASASHLSAFVPTELREALEESARAHDRSLSAEIRMALRAYISSPSGVASETSFAGAELEGEDSR